MKMSVRAQGSVRRRVENVPVQRPIVLVRARAVQAYAQPGPPQTSSNDTCLPLVPTVFVPPQVPLSVGLP